MQPNFTVTLFKATYLHREIMWQNATITVHYFVRNYLNCFTDFEMLYRTEILKNEIIV